MNNAYGMFKVSRESESKGIVLDYGEFRVTIARAGGANTDYKREMEDAARPHQKLIQNEQFSNDQADELLKKVYAKTVVKDWEVKVEDDDGFHYERGIFDPETDEVMPFTAENVLKVFHVPELNDLFLDIRDSAQKAALFRAALREEAAKNS